MHVLLVTSDYGSDHGGIGRHSCEVERALRAQGHRVTVEVLRAHRSCGSRQLDQVRDFLSAGSLLRTCRVLKPDIVYATTCLPCGFVASIARRSSSDMRLVVCVHGREVATRPQKSPSLATWVSRLLTRHTLLNADGVVAVSRFTKREVVKLSIPEHKVWVCHNGVSERYARCARSREEARRQRSSEGLQILTVGRLIPRKGHDRVIEVLATLRSEPNIPTTRYLIAGTGPYETHLRNLVTANALEGYVSFLGYVPDASLPELYASADIFAMPCRQEGRSVEGFGIVFLEAGMAGLPIVAGHSGGVDDYVVDGQNGVLVDPNDTAELRRELVQLLESPRRRRALGVRARQSAKKYSWNRTSACLVSVFTEILGEGTLPSERSSYVRP